MSYHDGARLPDWLVDRNHREAAERSDTQSEIDTARSAIRECIRLVRLQADGSRADFSAVIAELEEALEELPAMEE